MFNLALETSSPTGSIALGNSAVLAHEEVFAGDGRHSARLFPELSKIGLPRLALTRILVGLGPGSFSGVRVALAAAQGIALVQRVGVFGISSAFSVAWRHRQVTRLGVFADARRGEIYCTVFSRGELERETYLIKADQLEEEASKMTLAVSAEPLPGIATRAAPSARDLLELPPELPMWRGGLDLEPIYLR